MRQWADRLDPNYRPAPTAVGFATKDINTGDLVQEGDIVTYGALVVRQPLNQIRVVHSSIGTQANRSTSRIKGNWKNRR